MAALTDLKARKVCPGDKPIGDGTVPGLRLESGTVKGHGKWILRYVSPVTKRRRDAGLGRYPEISIIEARAKAMAARRQIAAGEDPIEERAKLKKSLAIRASVLTFEQASLQVYDEKKAGWKNHKHSDQWINTLRDYVFPEIGQRRVDELVASDFAQSLRPIWLKKAETASRIKQRCYGVMKWCMARGMVAGNPVDAVDDLLPKQPGKRERTVHQPSMPWRDLPEFVALKVRSAPSNVSRKLLEFVILTAARSGEARAMTWGEVDIHKRIWTIPANRMKGKLSHRVPLSGRVIEILNDQLQLHPVSELVFPSSRDKVLTSMVLTKFLRDKDAHSSEPGRIATAHGFRSSFRDWASENGYSRDLAERALAHIVGNQTEAAYHRTDLLEQRRPMMEAWAHFVTGVE